MIWLMVLIAMSWDGLILGYLEVKMGSAVELRFHSSVDDFHLDSRKASPLVVAVEDSSVVAVPIDPMAVELVANSSFPFSYLFHFSPLVLLVHRHRASLLPHLVVGLIGHFAVGYFVVGPPLVLLESFAQVASFGWLLVWLHQLRLNSLPPAAAAVVVVTLESFGQVVSFGRVSILVVQLRWNPLAVVDARLVLALQRLYKSHKQLVVVQRRKISLEQI